MFNFHTHSKDSNSIINIDSVHEIDIDENCFYSLGNHPWFEMESIDLMRKTIDHHPEIIALGECGLDKIKSLYSLEDQTLNLRAQIELSEELKLPLLLHIVRSHNEIIQLKKEIQPNQKWIIHGFNTYKQQELLLKSGFYLSYGKALLTNKKLQSAFIKTPQEKIFLETDDSELDIEKLYTFASALRKISTEQLITQIRKNLNTITNGRLA